MYTNYPMVRDYNMNYPYQSNSYPQEDDRFFWAPFVVGGLAGTALGYGIANNNQMNNQTYYPIYPMVPVSYSYPMYPTYSTSNNYYYQ